MALRDKLHAAAASHLEPGEQVQAVFAASAANPMWSLLSYWIIIAKDAYRAIVVTDRRIIVFRTSRLRFTKYKRIERTLPRSTPIGEPSGLNWRCESLGESLWIHKRFHKDVRQADAAIAAPGSTLPPPV
jgi:hypothetical protein